MLICPEASSAENNIAAVSADGSTVSKLMHCRGGGEPRPSSQAGNVVARGLGGEQEPGSRLLAECEPQMGWSAPNPRSSLLRIQLNYCSDPEVNQTLGGLRL
jgi:hypothetical protein